jgi:ribosomal protein L11 methyltransferase
MHSAPILYEINLTIDAPLAQALELTLEGWEGNEWSVHEHFDPLGRPEGHSLKGFFESHKAAAEGFKLLRSYHPNLPEEVAIERLEPHTWQDAYKEHLKPWSYGPLHWVPEWHWAEYPFPEGSVGVCLDPGMAFGTGSHETTRLLAKRLVDWQPTWPTKSPSVRVLDAGCGSGILALTAYQLGLRNISAFDIDPEAVRISEEHLERNHLPKGTIHFSTADLVQGLGNQPWDVILANIQTTVLIPNAKLLLQSLEPKGVLMLSGILTTELSAMEAALKEAAKALGWAPLEINSESLGDWCDAVVLHPEAKRH